MARIGRRRNAAHKIRVRVRHMHARGNRVVLCWLFVYVYGVCVSRLEKTTPVVKRNITVHVAMCMNGRAARGRRRR